MIGLSSGIVKLFEYDPEWEKLFEDESEVLRGLIGSYTADIQHIGSTSIAGLVAKPIIDVAVGLHKLPDVEFCISPLKSLGYEYKAENGNPGRHFFAKGNPRAFHLHFVEFGGELWRNYINFRNRLRESSEMRTEYARLKKDSARRYEYNRAAYTDSKTPFIEKVLKPKD